MNRNLIVLAFACLWFPGSMAMSGAEEQNSIFSEGLRWVRSKERITLQPDTYTVDYKAVWNTPRKTISSKEFESQLRTMIDHLKEVWKGIPELGASANPRDPDLVSLRIQQAAGCCRILHQDYIGDEKVKVRLRSKVPLFDIVPKAGDGNFLVEIEVSAGEERYRNYLYIRELLEFEEEGEEPGEQLMSFARVDKSAEEIRNVVRKKHEVPEDPFK